ncbi:MAG: SRPBCC domain-containing protein [Gemmataceae bacterium]|nr:SRPBCC domain-containing protein [Gemmataceae bacterium]MCS7269817.1 SRPBCC domain-containing protein [Gemmataceae bacterium]MDW8241593.1 SRPBCC domain-containing protein [Thermogemmata sp.]
MIHFEGELCFPLPLSEVAARLADAGYLVHSLPDVEVVSATPEKAVWRMKPKVSFLSGTQTTEITRQSYTPETEVVYTLVTRSIGGSVTVSTRLSLRRVDTGTQVNWSAEIAELTGLFKMVPAGLMKETARKVIDDVWEAVRKRLLSST